MLVPAAVDLMDEDIEAFADMDILAPKIKTALQLLPIFQISESPVGFELVLWFTVTSESRRHCSQKMVFCCVYPWEVNPASFFKEQNQCLGLLDLLDWSNCEQVLWWYLQYSAVYSLFMTVMLHYHGNNCIWKWFCVRVHCAFSHSQLRCWQKIYRYFTTK